MLGQGGQVVLIHRLAALHAIHHIREQTFRPDAPPAPAKLAIGAPGAKQLAQLLAAGDRLASRIGQGLGQPLQCVAHVRDALAHKGRLHAPHARLRAARQNPYLFQHPSRQQRICRRACHRRPEGNRRAAQRCERIAQRPARHRRRRQQPAPPLYRRQAAQKPHHRQRGRHAHVVPAQGQRQPAHQSRGHAVHRPVCSGIRDRHPYGGQLSQIDRTHPEIAQASHQQQAQRRHAGALPRAGRRGGGGHAVHRAAEKGCGQHAQRHRRKAEQHVQRSMSGQRRKHARHHRKAAQRRRLNTRPGPQTAQRQP